MKIGGEFEMRRPEELVDRRHGLEAEAAGGEDPRVADEGLGIARDRDRHGHVGCRQCRRLGAGAGPRRIEHHRIEPAAFVRLQRSGEEIAHFGRDPGQAARGHGQRRNGRAIGVDGVNLLPCGGKRKGEGAEAAEQIGDGVHLRRCREHRFAERGFAKAAGLQKGAWRNGDGGPGINDDGRAVLDDRFGRRRRAAPPREPGQPGVAGKAGPALAQLQRRRFRPVEDDIEAAVEPADRDPRLAAGRERVGEDIAHFRDESRDLRIDHRTDGQIDDVVAAGGGEADADARPGRGRPDGGEGRAPAGAGRDAHRRRYREPPKPARSSASRSCPTFQPI